MSKPNLPPLPQMDVGVSGQVKFAYSQEALTAYAEEAVRQALAAQVAVLTDAMILHRWDTHVGELSAGTTIEDSDKIAFARAVLTESASGHKPAPVDTSLGHSAPVAGEALTAEAVERQYRDGVHIGSGLQRTTCPCGFCAKHRHGFERGDDLAAPQASDKET